MAYSSYVPHCNRHLDSHAPIAALVTILALACGAPPQQRVDAQVEPAPDAATPDAATPDAATPDAATPDAAESPDANPFIRRVFVTSTTQNGNLGGFAGADGLCATQAADAGLSGTFAAWLSTLATPVGTRLEHSTVPYVRVDGTVVANNWDDLVDGELLAPINLDATGMTQFGDVWTGTLATGEPYAVDDCNEFTDDTIDRRAQCGNSNSMVATWTANVVPRCSVALRLYCFEQ